MNGKPRRCQSHCLNCGSHFFSDSAFDAHRQSFECWPEGAEDRLRVLNENAACEIVAQIGVTLYGVNPDFRSNSPLPRPSASDSDLDLKAA